MKPLALIRSHRKELFRLSIALPTSLGLLLLWEILGMYADDQALSGNTTVFLALIAAAFSLFGASTADQTGGTVGRGLRLGNPKAFFLFGGLLMLPNLIIPQFTGIPYPPPSVGTLYAFYAIAGTGAIGLFMFLMAFEPIILNAVGLGTKSAQFTFTASENYGPYRSC